MNQFSELLASPEEFKKSYQNPHRSDKFIRKPREIVERNISETCDMLHSLGNKISVREVRKITKTGSHTTISKYIKLWREKKTDAYALKVIQEHLDLVEEQKVISDFNSLEDDYNFLGKETQCDFTF